MDDETPEPAATDRPLAELPGFPPEAVAKLKARWVETVGQFLAMAATPPGMKGLSLLLSVDAARVQELVNTANGLVGSQEAERLAEARPGGPTGLVLAKETERTPEPDDAAPEPEEASPGPAQPEATEEEAEETVDEAVEEALEEECEDEVESEGEGEAEGGER